MQDDWPEDMDPHAHYQCWSPDTDEDRAAESFERRYGKPPEYVAVVRKMLRVGPVPEE